MEKKYISFDVEAAGPYTPRYSMLSIGACVVFEKEKTFYREIKPISKKFLQGAMVIGCMGLHSLKDWTIFPEYNPRHPNFNPAKVLELLEAKGEEPRVVMSDYADWVSDVTKGFKPIEAACPMKFDGSFTLYYFGEFNNGQNPFGHSGEDISSFFRGVTRNPNARLKDLKMRPKDGLTHNALEDAIQQAIEFEEALRLIAGKNLID